MTHTSTHRENDEPADGTTELLLSGLDGQNPLGLLAALGVLRIVTDHAAVNQPAPRLSWRADAGLRAVLHSQFDRQTLIDLLDTDRTAWLTEPAIQMQYEGKSGEPERELKPPPADYRNWVSQAAAVARPGGRRSVDLYAAFADGMTLDGSGATKPTALHFMAGPTKFLKAVLDLAEKVTAEHFAEAVHGPWKYHTGFTTLRWNAMLNRDYAYLSAKPASSDPTCVPGADWLAVIGLTALPVMPRIDRYRGQVRGAAVGTLGGWKSGRLRWPIWTVPVTWGTTKALLAAPWNRQTTRSALARQGVDYLFESKITRSDTGGYGSFSPAAAVPDVPDADAS